MCVPILYVCVPTKYTTIKKGGFYTYILHNDNDDRNSYATWCLKRLPQRIMRI